MVQTAIFELERQSQQDNNKIATKAIDSILSLVDDFDKAVTLLNQVDLSCLSNLIYKLDDNTKNNPKISFSRFVVGQTAIFELERQSYLKSLLLLNQ